MDERKEFLKWLQETYGLDYSWIQAPEVLARYTGDKLQKDVHFQYWSKYVKPTLPSYKPEKPKEFTGYKDLWPEEKKGAKPITPKRANFPDKITLADGTTISVNYTMLGTAKDEFGEEIYFYAPVLPIDKLNKAGMADIYNNIYGMYLDGSSYNAGKPLDIVKAAEFGIIDYDPLTQKVNAQDILNKEVFPTLVQETTKRLGMNMTSGMLDFLRMQTEKVKEGTFYADMDYITSELTKIGKYPDYEKRLRMMGKLPAPSAEDISYWIKEGQAKGEPFPYPEYERRLKMRGLPITAGNIQKLYVEDMEQWSEEDKQRSKALLGLFQEEEGTYGTGIEQTKATLEKLKPTYEKYKPMLEKGIIGGEQLGPLSEQLGLGAITEYERQSQLLKQYLSGEVLPYGISKEAQQYAQEYGVPIEQVGGLAQEWVANPQGEQFSGLNLEQRQGLTGIGLAGGGLRAGSTALLQEETLRKQKERQKQERWRELSLRAARPQKVTKI